MPDDGASKTPSPSTPSSGGQPPTGPAGGLAPRSGEVQPYELAPPEPTPPTLQTPPKGTIEKPGLLADFDEDADFDLDPEVQEAKTGLAHKPSAKPIVGKPLGKPTDTSDVTDEVQDNRMVVPGRGDLKTIAIIGAAVTFAAAIAAAINAAPERNRFLVALLMAFDVALHTVTGVGAIGLAAAMIGKVLRQFELAAARMLVATAFFALGFQLDFQSPAHTFGLALAAGSYFLSVWFLFKLKAQDTVVVGGFHFALWILFYLHHQLSTWAAPAASAAAPAAGG
jgi:hypothetical protein